jgi:hypothetical protein
MISLIAAESKHDIQDEEDIQDLLFKTEVWDRRQSFFIYPVYPVHPVKFLSFNFT